MGRVYNFSAGPAVLPEEVLKDAAAEMLDYELMNAFELEVHLKRYVKKMEKRFRKINTFSKFNLRYVYCEKGINV